MVSKWPIPLDSMADSVYVLVMNTNAATNGATTMTKQQARRIAKAEQDLEYAQASLTAAMQYAVPTAIARGIKARDKATAALIAARRDAGLEN